MDKEKDLPHNHPHPQHTSPIIYVLNGAIKLIAIKDPVEYIHHLVPQINISHVFFSLMKPQRSSFKAS